jgi:hypothetical protein
MKSRTVAVTAALAVAAGVQVARADGGSEHLSFTTLAITEFPIEGLTGDNASNVYTTGRAPSPTRCPVWQFNVDGTPPVAPVVIGTIPNASGCNPSGIARDASGNFYVADGAQGGVIWRITGNDPHPAAPFVTGVPGTNGLAFDRFGNLWTGDGTTGQGRVWKIAPTGGTCEPAYSGCQEAFRIPPMANLVGVGRQASTLQPPAAANPQSLVANGLAFDRDHSLFIADTARGAIWRVRLDRDGNVRSPRGCDETYTDNTLCFSNVFVAHPVLEGTDGIALDVAGNIWNAANERNAIVAVTPTRFVVEMFRNPVNAQGLRNAADDAEGNRHILEFPTSPYLNGRRLCVAQSDGDRRDNSPRAAGEVNGGAGTARGKISCADQRLGTRGLGLPVH